MGSWCLSLYPPWNNSAAAFSQIAVSTLASFVCLAWRLSLNMFSSINVETGGRCVRPILFWMGLTVLPIPNHTSNTNWKSLTRGNFKKEVKNALLDSTALENTFYDLDGWKVHWPRTFPWGNPSPPPTNVKEESRHSESLLKLWRLRVCRNIPLHNPFLRHFWFVLYTPRHITPQLVPPHPASLLPSIITLLSLNLLPLYYT